MNKTTNKSKNSQKEEKGGKKIFMKGTYGNVSEGITNFSHIIQNFSKVQIINWELSLTCNLNCSFCSQKERRELQKKQISFEESLNIVKNLPQNSHISFLGGETLLFKDIKKLFSKLDEIGITYEITTNGTLLKNFLNDLGNFKNLTQINISIDGFGKEHDLSRGKKGLFDEIIEILPEILKIKKVNISTVIGEKLSIKNLILLYKTLNNIGINEIKLIYLMNFSKKDIISSKKTIKSLKINSPGGEKIENENYKNEFLKKVILLKKVKEKTNIKLEPETIVKKGIISCKQLDNQYRINENGKLSICEFITNEYSNLKNIKFEEAIKNEKYIKLKEEIKKNFPLNICQTCCKQYNKNLG